MVWPISIQRRYSGGKSSRWSEKVDAVTLHGLEGAEVERHHQPRPDVGEFALRRRDADLDHLDMGAGFFENPHRLVDHRGDSRSTGKTSKFGL